MRKKLFFVLAACLLGLQAATAQIADMPALHVQGRYLVDEDGNITNLHGVMDTPHPFFNNYRWGSTCNRNSVKSCLAYFEKLFTAITDHDQGAYCNILRLCVDGCWISDPTKTATDATDLSVYSQTRLRNYLDWLFVPLVKQALNHGLYVVLRPPYGPPATLKIGDDYQKHLEEVWSIIASHDSIQKYSGQISFELTNEPVNIADKLGNTSKYSLISDYFQPVVDTIRAAGFDGVIWVPGLGYQSLFQGYATNPIEDELNNIGYAAHVYPGWYLQSDDNADGEAFIAQFLTQVPVVETNPVLVSEVDWSPVDPDSEGKYNEFGEWVQGNYGTWGTGSTSKWGTAYKTMIDHFGNISMTLQGTAVYLDIDQYLEDGTVQPAFDGLWEACAAPCFQWYKEYYEAEKTTGITSVTDDRQSAATDGCLYNLQGQRIQNPRKGEIYIKNGKKYIY